MINSELKPNVLKVLSHHRGRKNAIKAMDLAQLLGYSDDRVIQKAIAELIIDDKIPIAAALTSPFGYYLIESQQEAEEYLHSLRDRIKNTCIRRADFKRAAYLNLNKLIQGRLEI